jgi:putative flippase GtrA
VRTALRLLLSLYVSVQFGRFLLVGGVALALHWLSRFIFNWFVGYGWAIVLAYGVGMFVGFILNKVYVFPYSERPLHFEASFFLLVNIVAFPVVWAVAYILGEWVFPKWMPKELALALGHAFAIVLPVFANFALHKFITFRGPDAST